MCKSFIYLYEVILGLKWSMKSFTCFFKDCLIHSLSSCYFSDQETHGLPAKKTPLTLKETVILSTLWENGRPQIFQEFYVMFNRFAYYAERTDKVMWNSTVRNIINTKLVDQGILSQIKLSDEEKESIRKKFKNPNARSTNKYGMFYLD